MSAKRRVGEARAAPGRERGEPVENALVPGQFGEKHHAREEQIDVGAFGDGAEGEARREEAEGDEQGGAKARPYGLGPSSRPDDDAGDRSGGDCPNQWGAYGQRLLSQLAGRVSVTNMLKTAAAVTASAVKA